MPMHVSSTDGPTPATLNSLAAFDAVVIPGITASGRHYPTVTAAMVAGRKSIAVTGGAYAAGFTITASGTRVVGLDLPIGALAGSLSAGPVFGAGIVINASNCELINLGVDAAVSVGIQIGQDYSGNRIRNCAVCNTTGTAVYIYGGHDNLIADCQIVANDGNGIIAQCGSAGDTFFGIRILDNFVYQCAGSGILAADYGTDTAQSRETRIQGNTVWDCCTEWGNGITIDSAQMGLVLANTVFSCGDGDTSSSGIRVESLIASPAHYAQIIGNRCYSNTGYGIDLAAASAAIAVVGNNVFGNGVGNYRNCGSSPGYATGTYGTNI